MFNVMFFGWCVGDFMIIVISDGYFMVSFDFLLNIDVFDVIVMQCVVGQYELFVVYINCYVVCGVGCMIFVDVGVGGIR